MEPELTARVGFRFLTGGIKMRTTLATLALASGIGLIACGSATALPISAAPIQQSAAATSDVTQAQYSERRTRHGIKKCYREFVVGNYVCRTY
jgi:hypothetical protein